MARKNPAPNTAFHIHAPKFPKPQTEGWFVVLGNESTDEVYALKRVGWPSGTSAKKPSIKITLQVPESLKTSDYDTGGGAGRMTLWIVSDGYLGLVYKEEC